MSPDKYRDMTDMPFLLSPYPTARFFFGPTFFCENIFHLKVMVIGPWRMIIPVRTPVSARLFERGTVKKPGSFLGCVKRWSHGDENHVSMCWDDPPVICGDHTWRIIPVSKWLITMVIVSPLTRDIPLPNRLNGL